MPDVLLKRASIQDVILETKIEGPFVVPSNVHLDETEQRLINATFRTTLLKKALAGLDYDFVVIDCRPTLGTLTANAPYAAGLIVIPCEKSRYSLEGFKDLIENVLTIKNKRQVEFLDYAGVLLTECNVRTREKIVWATLVRCKTSNGFRSDVDYMLLAHIAFS